MEEAPENGKESSHSAHANGMNESMLAGSFLQMFHDRLSVPSSSFKQAKKKLQILDPLRQD
jgi:hypothetical protein